MTPQPQRVDGTALSHFTMVEAHLYSHRLRLGLAAVTPLSWRLQSFDGARVLIETETGSMWVPTLVLEEALRCAHLDRRRQGTP